MIINCSHMSNFQKDTNQINVLSILPKHFFIFVHLSYMSCSHTFSCFPNRFGIFLVGRPSRSPARPSAGGT